MPTLTTLLDELKDTYLELHTRKEDCFWIAKMGLEADAGEMQRKLAEAEIALNRFLQDPQRYKQLREMRADSAEEQHLLNGWIALFQAHVVDDPQARALSEELVELEQALQEKRATCALGYTDPESGDFHKASSVKLSLMMRNDPDERRRKAAYEGLRALEQMVMEWDFLTIVRKRNQLGRMLGFVDYYDWRTSVVERLSKVNLFAVLDDLKVRTAARTQEQLRAFEQKFGDGALEPWNFMFLRAGDLTRRLDPFFAFHQALRLWGRSFMALGVRYRNATLTLDLLDRPGKYENGFMHGPEPCFYDRGEWRPARINFTSNAIPGQVGSGLRAIETLFHEGGHAAHFSNITQSAPCFSQEFAPTSVAYAETQSMFMDSLIGDADWRVRYAQLPMELVEDAIRETQPLRGWDVRALLTIPLAERALYELPDTDLQPERVLDLFRSIERETQGLSAGVRPVLAVPHLLAGESSAYYHGYVMAEMAVYQTRHHFLQRDGYLTDNPRIGPDLAQHYWAPGNAATFNETLQSLTGRPLSADALVAACNRSTEDALEEAGRQVEAQRGRRIEDGSIQLEGRVRIVHGNDTIADTAEHSFEDACARFESWIQSLSR